VFKKMGLLTKWNEFALKKIQINDHMEIAVGRMIFGIIIFLITTFTTVSLSWIFLLYGLKIHKKNNKEKKENECC